MSFCPSRTTFPRVSFSVSGSGVGSGEISIRFGRREGSSDQLRAWQGLARLFRCCTLPCLCRLTLWVGRQPGLQVFPPTPAGPRAPGSPNPGPGAYAAMASAPVHNWRRGGWMLSGGGRPAQVQVRALAFWLVLLVGPGFSHFMSPFHSRLQVL